MAQPDLLLVDVGHEYADAFREWCGSRDIRVVATRGDLAEASENVGLCILSISANDDRGTERARALLKTLHFCPTVALLDKAEVELAVALVRLGIADVIGLPKPAGELVVTSMRHFADSGQGAGRERLVGQSPQIAELRELLRRAAGSRSTVLIEGETGTGKGILAREIHETSAQRARPFVHVDCAALAPERIESELFGHERAAFPGADGLRRGRFEAAADGTLFLDEIGCFDLEAQAKLLGVLGQRMFARVGGAHAIPLRARVIAATSRDLLRDVSAKRFRSDLFFRLNVLHFDTPPLRERLEDIPLLVQAGLAQLAERLVAPIPRVSDAFYERLSRHDWPGNVRELMNLLERLLVQGVMQELLASDLDGLLVARASAPRHEAPDPAPAQPPAPGHVRGVADDETALIRSAIKNTGGNVSRAARRLNIARGTLRYRLRRLGLEELIPRD